MKVLSANVIQLRAKLFLVKFTIFLTFPKLIFLHSNILLITPQILHKLGRNNISMETIKSV